MQLLCLRTTSSLGRRSSSCSWMRCTVHCSQHKRWPSTRWSWMQKTLPPPSSIANTGLLIFRTMPSGCSCRWRRYVSSGVFECEPFKGPSEASGQRLSARLEVELVVPQELTRNAGWLIPISRFGYLVSRMWAVRHQGERLSEHLSLGCIRRRAV